MGKPLLPHEIKAHEPYLTRCISLAERASSAVYPNPRVGAVIVFEDKIIGEGYHHFAGGPHAEVHAINSVKEPSLLMRSTLYVSLEPCNHFGKTPPCTDLILRHKIPHVVVGCTDPNPRVAGKGLARLQDAGVQVELAQDTMPFRALNKVFFVNQQQQRPYIVLKWAQSADAFIAGLGQKGEGRRTQISSPKAQVYTHRLRAWHHAILVGRKTAMIDNPALTTRLFPGKHPLRIVMDKDATLSPHLTIFTDAYPTLVLSDKPVNMSLPKEKYTPAQWSHIPSLCKELFQEKGLCSILVEGGNYVLSQFLESGFFDELHVIQSPKRLGKGIPAPLIEGLEPNYQGYLGEDILYVYSN